MDKKLLKENEKIDDLQLNNLYIIQNKEYFSFGIDAVLLSDFLAQSIQYKTKNKKYIDLGTGTGIIPILLSEKTNLEHLDALEIQEQIANMAFRSVKLNNLEEKISIITGDIKEIPKNFEKESYDYVSINPPYMKSDKSSAKNPCQQIARQEIQVSLEQIFENIKYILKNNGRLFMVHRPTRLSDILYLSRKYNIEAKKLQFVQKNPSTPSNIVLIEFVKNAKPELKILPNLYLYEA